MLAAGQPALALPRSSSPGQGVCKCSPFTAINHNLGNAAQCGIDFHSRYCCNDGGVMAMQTPSHTSSGVVVDSTATFCSFGFLGKRRLALGGRRLGDWQKSSTLLIPAVHRHTTWFSQTGAHHGCHSRTRHRGRIMFHHRPIHSSELPFFVAIPSAGLVVDIGAREGLATHLARQAPRLRSSRCKLSFGSQSSPDSVASLAPERSPPFNIYDDKEVEFFQAGRELHLDLRRKIESEGGVTFKDNKAPPELTYMSNPDNLARGSFVLRNGDGDEVHAMVEGAIRMVRDGKSIGTSFFSLWMGPSTDAPHIMFEWFMSEKRVFFLMDLKPRRDLVLHVDYLDEVYMNSGLEELRNRCDKDERMKKYHLTRLYAQHSFSPSYLAYTVALSDDPINKDEGGEEDGGPMPRALREVVRPIALECLDIWLSLRRSRANNVSSSSDRESLARRDYVHRAETIRREEGLERTFGVELASKLKDAIKSV
ncbi:hypothetical protein CBR_g39811 [Chara braunii]|uniref:Uncharacterized protein n=1 Tax=Chara braunii TaxID=69332 RepID=A0A388LSL8_CHABU|nr:hypothetical protein CBR_g39811 [Chara braunii]|eukprot:GBG85245.1 hypothetical protein CBR_g39811 [Chara braunii]